MSGEAKLGWAGVALAILGLPSTLLLFYQEYTVIGILSAIIVVGIIGVVWGMYWLLNQQSFTVLEIDKTLSFQDEHGYAATYTDARKARANHKGLTEFWFKDVGSEHAVDNLLIDGAAPDLEEILEDGRKKGACKRYPGGLQWRERVEPTVTLTYRNTFLDGRREFFTHKVMDKTNRVRVKLEFHDGKRPRHMEVRLGHGGHRGDPLKNPQLRRLQDGKVWVWEKVKPSLGENYRIEWEW